MKGLIIIFISVLFFSCGHPDYKNPHVIISTRLGDIEVELFPDQAPKTVAAFLSYVDSGLYTDVSFYRVLKGEELPTDYNTGIIQGGVYQSPGKKPADVPPIPHEPTTQTGLSHINGAISFASLGAGTATTEFFICIGDQSVMDAERSGTEDKQGFAVFGKVFKGMDVVRKIQNQKSRGDKFEVNVGILDIKKL